MIVRCEKCETRFKLDETRLPARGARVRCSRCKHAFFVTPPQVDREAVVQALADEVTQGRARAPEPAWDLEDRGPTARGDGERRTRGERGQPDRAIAAPDANEDSDWTFEDHVPGLSGDGASLDGQEPAAGPLSLGGDPNEDSLAGLGSPESWDLLTQPDPPAPPAPARPTLPAPAVRPPPEPEPAPVEIARSAPVAKPVPAEPVFAAPVEATQKVVVSWPGLAGVVALGIAIALGSVHAAGRAETAASLAPIAGLEVASARARWIENARVGPILVVSGELRNPGPAARSLGAELVVSLLDGDGAPIDEPEAVAAAPLGEEPLREQDPRLLRSEQQRSAGEWAAGELQPGATLAFDAVFERFPAGARRFDLAARPIAPVAQPAPRPPAAPTSNAPAPPPPAPAAAP